MITVINTFYKLNLICLNLTIYELKEGPSEASDGLQLNAHPIHLLHIGEHHLGVYPLLRHHAGHVFRCQEVRYASQFLSRGEGDLIVLEPIGRRVCFQSSVVECVGEEVVNESTEGETVSPGLSEVQDVDIVVLPGPALAPNQDCLHLGGERLLPGDPQLNCQACVSSNSSALTVWVKSRSWVF